MGSRKVQQGALLVAVFCISFSAIFLIIFFTQPAYSTPDSGALRVGEMEIEAGPAPNATNVAIDTTITIDAVASATLDDLKVEPEVPIDRTHGETSGPLTYLTIFYPAELLRSDTRYTVSVSVMGERAVWSFTTTSEPFEPGVRFYLAKNVLWISLFAASTATFTVGFVLSRKNRERREVAESTSSKPLRS